MMKRLASLSFLAACAHQPVAPAPPPTGQPPGDTAPACKPGGAVLFEIDTNDLAAGPQKEIVFANGAWQLDKAGGGTTTGCLAAGDLATIQKDVASPWTTSPRTGITCHMVHAPTNYVANGKTVYADSGCESPILDEASTKALAEIMQIVQKAEKA